MNKKGLYGILCILLMALAGFAAASLYGRSIKLNYIEQIHLQGGYLYYVDREDKDSLKIIRSDPQGKNGEMIIFQKHVGEQYRIINQIFYDEENNAYVIIEETNVTSWNGVSSKIYRCDFDHGRLEETGYDLTEDRRKYAKISIQRIRDGKLFYICVPDSDTSSGNACLFTLDANGRKEKQDEIHLEYPNLNAQFFLNKDNILLWTDYAGQIYAKELGTENYLEIEGITGKKGVVKSICNDGKYAYVLDYASECIRCIDLREQTSQVQFSAEEIQKRYPDFTFRELHNLDCIQQGFCAGVQDEQGMLSICSYFNDRHEDIDRIYLTFRSGFLRMFWVYVVILITAVLLSVYWLFRVKYHFQSILVNLGLIFLLGLVVMDEFLESWIDQSMCVQLESTQTLSLSALGKVLKEDIIKNIETNAEELPSGNRALVLSHYEADDGAGTSSLPLYSYSVLCADEEGQLYVIQRRSGGMGLYPGCFKICL